MYYSGHGSASLPCLPGARGQGIDMIVITTTSKALAHKAESVMAFEVLHNPNLNGAEYAIEAGDFDSIDGGDNITTAGLYKQIFSFDE